MGSAQERRDVEGTGHLDGNASATAVGQASIAVLGLGESQRSAERRDRPDPLAAVSTLGSRTAAYGAAFALGLAFLSHGAISVRALSALFAMQHAVDAMRVGQHEFFWTTYDIDMPPPPKDEAPPPPPPPPEPIAKPEPAPVNNAVKAPPKDDPYDPPSTPAQATKVLTAPAKDDEPLDLTGKGFVTGDGTGPGYGMVSGDGKGNVATFNPHASHAGVPGGTGSVAAPPPPPPPGPDLSRPPVPVGGASWNCPFPPEADTDQIDQAVAVIMVTVRPDGSPISVKVVTDPGHGFGRAARMCALGRRFTAGLDRSGQPTTLSSPPITVRFTR